MMQIRLFFQNLPVYPYSQQLRWGTRIVSILAGCALTFFLLKKFISWYSSPPPPKLSANRRPAATPARRLAANRQYLITPLLPPNYLTSLKMSYIELRKYGIQNTRDLQCLNLFCFDEKIKNIEQKIKHLAMSPRVEYVLLQRGTLVHRIEESCLEKDYEIIEEIYQQLMDFMNIFKEYYEFIEGLCLSPIPHEFDLFQDMENIRKSLSELEAQCALRSSNEKGHAKGLSTLKAIARQITELDKRRQIYWLKAYLAQHNLLQFWNREQPDEKARSLYKYFLRTNRSGWYGYRMNS